MSVAATSVLKNFGNFTGEDLSLFNKVASL